MDNNLLNRKDISTSAELKEVCKPLEDIIRIIKKYSNSLKAKSNYFVYHNEWPVIEIIFKKEFDNFKKFYVKKNILLTIKDYKLPPIYEMRVIVTNDYGLKELFTFIPGCHKKRNSWKRYRWERTIKNIAAPFNEENLLISLKEAVEILNNFNELELSPII